MQDLEGCEKRRMTVLLVANGRMCGGKVVHLLIKGFFCFFKGGIRWINKEFWHCFMIAWYTLTLKPFPLTTVKKKEEPENRSARPLLLNVGRNSGVSDRSVTPSAMPQAVLWWLRGARTRSEGSRQRRAPQNIMDWTVTPQCSPYNVAILVC